MGVRVVESTPLDELVPDEPDTAPAARPSRLWAAVGYLGEVLITAGVVLLLLVVYELWWTNVVAEQQAEQQREQLLQAWEQQPSPDPAPTAPAETPVAVAPIPAEAFALMYIPRLQTDVWATPVIEGVTTDDLAKGIGHFPDSALPGEVGNAAFAGHRATHGEPLANVDALQVGDLVYIQTATGWYTYKLTHDQLVMPWDVWVIDPVPGQAGAVPTEPLLTLVTCHPRWGSTQRWIWWGELTEERSTDQGPPEEVANIIQGGA
jgi:sortase A